MPANTVTSNNVLQPIVIYKEHTVLGLANVNGNSFVIAPVADLTDSLGLATNRWGNVYTYGISLGNTTINSYGNSTANSTGATGYSVLPGGLIMQWGAGAAGTAQTFSVPFPTGVLSVHVTGTQANAIYATANTTKISTTATGGAPTFNYLVIGN